MKWTSSIPSIRVFRRRIVCLLSQCRLPRPFLVPTIVHGCFDRSARPGPAWCYAGIRHSPPILGSNDRAEREGRPSGESWRCRGKMSGGRRAQQSVGCRKTWGRGAKRTQMLAMGCSTRKPALWQGSPVCRINRYCWSFCFHATWLLSLCRILILLDLQ